MNESFEKLVHQQILKQVEGQTDPFPDSCLSTFLQHIYFIYLFDYLTGKAHSFLAVPESVLSSFTYVVPGQETENNISK